MLVKTRWNHSLMTPLEKKAYSTWVSMRNRCKNPGCTFYQHYGGRGIKVCDRWKDDLLAFVEDMGLPPSMDVDLDRIDNNGNYEPKNCRWIPHRENLKNMRSNRHITIDGVTKLMSEWCDEYGIKRSTMFYRLQLGWTGKKLLEVPRDKNDWAKRFTINGESRTAAEWAALSGISVASIHSRWAKGIRGERLIAKRLNRGEMTPGAKE